MKYKLFIEYDGTNYSGWQKQNNAKTVQGSLIKAVESAFKKSKGESKLIDIQGSGRTDSGVHAIEQVAHIDCNTMLAPHILQFKINDELPSDINILNIEKADERFHARHSAEARQYLYRISKRRTAFDKKYVWWIKDDLDVFYMNEAAQMMTGMNNFQSFSEPDKENKSTKVLVEFIEITEDEELILIRIKASHFLWKMVRRVTGILVECGRGNIKKENIKNYLAQFSNEPAKYTAPPSGLFLEKVYYEK
ncbi:MAG TPA: tRNA pseudouridine(38-40) synthase TruA [Ignavibacteria bacterium]|nr:tRNA pseudouridine(38-40) synthase TruA [Ignavibacteria bacterium]HMR39614.1 tRNA pseudouridine(38-40) synthase TruA [Ignavibacteria bacterium]